MFGTVGFGYGSLRSIATAITYKLSTLATTDKGDRLRAKDFWLEQLT